MKSVEIEEISSRVAELAVSNANTYSEVIHKPVDASGQELGISCDDEQIAHQISMLAIILDGLGGIYPAQMTLILTTYNKALEQMS